MQCERGIVARFGDDESDVERRSWLFFRGLLEHAAVESQLGDRELEAADLGFEFGYAQLYVG